MPTLKRDLFSTISAKDIAKLAKSGDELLKQKYNAERYHRILQFPRKDIADDKFVEDVYEMLKDFKMDSQGARLSDLKDFKKTIKKHADTIQSLAKFTLETVKATDESFKESIASLFDSLYLTQTNSPLVTFAKTMHFLLPDLFMPIDRRYTLRFFQPGDLQKACSDKAKVCFFQVFEQFRAFAQEHHAVLKEQVDKTSCWNRNIPKVIDNIIIAYMTKNPD